MLLYLYIFCICILAGENKMLLYCGDDLYHKRGIVSYIGQNFNFRYSFKAYHDKTNNTYMVKIYMHQQSRNKLYFLYQR